MASNLSVSTSSGTASAGAVGFTNQDQLLIQKFNTFAIAPKQYPSDLGGEDLKHWVRFSINVRGKSEVTLGNERQIGDRVRTADSANQTPEQLSRATDTLAGISGAVAGAAGGKAVVSFLASLRNRGQRTGGAAARVSTAATAVGVVGGALAGSAAALLLTKFSDQLKPDTSRRIDEEIALYIDGPPTVRYAAQYSNKDLGTIAGLAGGGLSAVDSLSGAGETASALAAQFAKLPGALGVNLPDVLSASAKVSLNPFREVIFEAIDFRSFNFKYRFFPKSREESKSVEDIIKIFKFHMHPELSANKLFFIYPSEFEIGYYFQNKENTYFHKFKPCVLDSMDISYGGEQFSSFVDGNPTEVNMSLTFRETEILTKKQIRDGF